LAAPFDFTTFFTLAILNRAAPFFTARLFLSRYILQYTHQKVSKARRNHTISFIQTRLDFDHGFIKRVGSDITKRS